MDALAELASQKIEEARLQAEKELQAAKIALQKVEETQARLEGLAPRWRKSAISSPPKCASEAIATLKQSLELFTRGTYFDLLAAAVLARKSKELATVDEHTQSSEERSAEKDRAVLVDETEANFSRLSACCKDARSDIERYRAEKMPQLEEALVEARKWCRNDDRPFIELLEDARKAMVLLETMRAEGAEARKAAEKDKAEWAQAEAERARVKFYEDLETAKKAVNRAKGSMWLSILGVLFLGCTGFAGLIFGWLALRDLNNCKDEEILRRVDVQKGKIHASVAIAIGGLWVFAYIFAVLTLPLASKR